MILRLTDEAPVSFARQRDRTHNLWSSTRWRAKAMLQCGIWSVLDGADGLLWVNSTHWGLSSALPLCPNQRTLSRPVETAESCHEETYAVQRKTRSLDQLVGAQQK